MKQAFTRRSRRTATTKDMALGAKIRNGLLAGGASLAALAAVNAKIARGRDRQRKQDEASAPQEGSARQSDDARPGESFSGDARLFSWIHGDIFYRVAGEPSAPALVLIHDISAGASHFTWRRNFNELARDFQVFALDLPGFGASAKPPLAPYSADFYVEALTDFLREVVGRPAHLVGASMSAIFAIRAADEHPEFVRDLVLLTPPVANFARPGMTGAAFYGLLHSPVLGTSFYNAVASERSLRDHARKNLFYDKRLATPRLIAHLYRLSHQPGAQHAISAFLSGYLNTDVRDAFTRLRQRTIIAWGAEDRLNPVAGAQSLARLNPRTELVLFDNARAWLHDEYAPVFNRIVRGRLLDAEQSRIARSANALLLSQVCIDTIA